MWWISLVQQVNEPTLIGQALFDGIVEGVPKGVDALDGPGTFRLVGVEGSPGVRVARPGVNGGCDQRDLHAVENVANLVGEIAVDLDNLVLLFVAHRRAPPVGCFLSRRALM